MERLNYKKEFILWVLLIVPFIYILCTWNTLPDRVPIHFGTNGQPNGWSGKWGVFFVPVTNLIVYIVLLLIPVIDPKRMNAGFFDSNFYKIRLTIVFFFCLFSLLPVIAALHGPVIEGHNWMFMAIFALLAVLGNFMINIKPNWFAGMRTPWTLSSDMVWKKTHQVFGRTWFYGGLAGIVLAIFLPTIWVGRLLIGFALASALFAYGYSFWLFKREEIKQK